MAKRKDISIRFCLSGGEGEYVQKSKFSKKELRDVRTCLSLVLDYVPNLKPAPKILSIQILHDGITPVEGEIEGYVINRDEDYPLEGYPTPVVRFHLDIAMDEEEFRQAIFGSSYSVSTEAMKKDGEESYHAEDHNGYSSVLSRTNRGILVSMLEDYDAYCGKTFEFPDGMPENGHAIPAIEFALKP